MEEGGKGGGKGEGWRREGKVEGKRGGVEEGGKGGGKGEGWRREGKGEGGKKELLCMMFYCCLTPRRQLESSTCCTPNKLDSLKVAHVVPDSLTIAHVVPLTN